MLKLKPALQSSEGRSTPWSGSTLVNCYAEASDGDKREAFAVMTMAGLDLFSTITSDPVRGHIEFGSYLYVVAGSDLYLVDGFGNASAIAGVPGTDMVRMAKNATQIALVADSTGYVLDAGTLATPTDLPSVSDICFVDGYFLWTVAATGQFTITAFNDGTTYDPLDIATAEGGPDNLIGCVADHREVHLFGQKSIEIWYNSGAADFPFERQGNAFIERGCFDRDSIVQLDNSLIFFGDDRIVYRLNGYTPVRISTHAIEYALRNAAYARAFTFNQEGHKFYALGTDVGTFVHDIATGAWHERRSWELDNWRVNGAVTFGTRTILSDGYTGLLYASNFDTHEENGEPISVEITLPTIESGDRSEMTMYAFEVVCETGVGLETGEEPQIAMTYSDDGGRSWSNELWRSLGVVGAYRTRAVWRKLGQFWQRQIRLVMTDPVRRFVISYYADIS